MRALRVGLFTDVFLPDPNGVSTSVLLLQRELRARGHEAWVVAPALKRTGRDPEGVARVPSLPLLGVSQQRFALPLRRRLPGPFDLIHTHTPWVVGWWGARLARRTGAGHVSTFHTHLEAYTHYVPGLERLNRRTGAVSRIARRFYSQADLIVAPSVESRCLLEGYGVRVPARVLPSGINAALLEAAPDQPSPWPPGKRRLLTVGRLGREKRMDLLLSACARLAGAHLVVIGDGPQAAQLRAQARELGLTDAVTFLGTVPYELIGAYYRMAELFCFASDTETQGLVLHEAQALGLPVVAVGAQGTLGSVNSGVSGVLVPPGDTDALAREIAALLADPPRLAAYREGARAFAGASGAARMAERMLELYDEVLNPGQARRVWADFTGQSSLPSGR